MLAYGELADETLPFVIGPSQESLPAYVATIARAVTLTAVALMLTLHIGGRLARRAEPRHTSTTSIDFPIRQDEYRSE